MAEITRILTQLKTHESQAAADLFQETYSELRRIAAWRMQSERAGHTLQPTALVHEAWLRLLDSETANEFKSRQHFYSVAAEVMRRILIDAARRKAGIRSGGGLTRLDVELTQTPEQSAAAEAVAVHEGLEALELDDPVAAELVKLHYFSGLSLEEAAALLEVSRATAYRLWTYARAFLKDTLIDRVAK
jgi:RNA polymerase sigma factor (TIGR02999 family)